MLDRAERKCRILAAGLLAGIFVAAATPGFAMTCTDRQQVCFAYCQKSYRDGPACRAACAGLLSRCMSTGCWESKVTAKQCGFTKQ